MDRSGSRSLAVTEEVAIQSKTPITEICKNLYLFMIHRPGSDAFLVRVCCIFRAAMNFRLCCRSQMMLEKLYRPVPGVSSCSAVRLKQIELMYGVEVQDNFAYAVCTC